MSTAIVLDRADASPTAIVTTASTPSASRAPTPPSVGHPAPSAPPSAPSGSGGGGASASSPTSFQGQVLDLADRPIAEATIRTSDGRRTLSGAEGRFTLSGPFPSDGIFVASHPGYVASAIAGLGGDGPMTLHLQPQTEETDDAIEPDRAFQVRGRVADPAGRPVEGVLVTLGDARGASAVPVETDAAGWFELTVFAPLPHLANATLLAAGQGWMAVATGLNAVPSAPFLDFDPSDPALSPLLLKPATQTVTLAVDDTPAGLSASRTVELAAADGVRLSLDASGPSFAWAPQSGLSATLRVEARDADRGLSSEFVHRLAPSDTHVTDVLLAPPSFSGAPQLRAGESLAWNALRGIDGYQLSLSSPVSSGPVWEGFTSQTRLILSPETLAAGPYALSLTAWQGKGLAPRSVASVGTRALRLLPADTYKRATRTLDLMAP